MIPLIPPLIAWSTSRDQNRSWEYQVCWPPPANAKQCPKGKEIIQAQTSPRVQPVGSWNNRRLSSLQFMSTHTNTVWNPACFNCCIVVFLLEFNDPKDRKICPQCEVPLSPYKMQWFSLHITTVNKCVTELDQKIKQREAFFDSKFYSITWFYASLGHQNTPPNWTQDFLENSSMWLKKPGEHKTAFNTLNIQFGWVSVNFNP